MLTLILRLAVTLTLTGASALTLLMTAAREHPQSLSQPVVTERSNQLIVPITTVPKTVTTELYRPPPVPMPLPRPPVIEETPAPLPERPVAQPGKKQPYDICRGRGRTYSNGGKSWRCNR